jgi:hypothetical protein
VGRERILDVRMPAYVRHLAAPAQGCWPKV